MGIGISIALKFFDKNYDQHESEFKRKKICNKTSTHPKVPFNVVVWSIGSHVSSKLTDK